MTTFYISQSNIELKRSKNTQKYQLISKWDSQCLPISHGPYVLETYTRHNEMSEFVKFYKTPIEAPPAITTDHLLPTTVSVCLREDTPSCVYTHIALNALDLAAFELQSGPSI